MKARPYNALCVLAGLFVFGNAHAAQTADPPAATVPPAPPSAVPAAQPSPNPPISEPVPTLALREVKKTGNLLLNPDFESPKDEKKPDWWSYAGRNTESWVDFAIVSDKGRDTSKAARLVVDSTGRSNKTAISGVVQEVKGDHVPEKLSGWYFVENWEKNTPKQYLQAVVIVWRDAKATRAMVNAPSIQIAYTFTGVKTPPKVITNRKFVILGDETPKTGEWVHFEVKPREDFVKLWQIDPGNFEFVRVFFELRYDDFDVPVATTATPNTPTTPTTNPPPPPTKGTCYYDDLYFGD